MSVNENAISNMLGDGFEVEDKDGKTWRIGLITKEVLSDMEVWLDKRRKTRMREWAKDESISPQELSSHLAALDKQTITYDDVQREMQSISGMQFLLWRCLVTHHAGIDRRKVFSMFTDEQTASTFEELFERSTDQPKDVNPTNTGETTA